MAGDDSIWSPGPGVPELQLSTRIKDHKNPGILRERVGTDVRSVCPQGGCFLPCSRVPNDNSLRTVLQGHPLPVLGKCGTALQICSAGKSLHAHRFGVRDPPELQQIGSNGNETFAIWRKVERL